MNALASTTETFVRYGERTLTLTNLDKLLWPADGLTKADYLRYCARVAPWLLAHLRDRPLVLTRYPDGIDGKSFYQKDAPDYAPPWVRLYPHYSADSGRWLRFIVCDDAATLLWVANQAALELHPWLSRADAPERPDFAVIDLDPAEGATYRDACEVARLIRDVLTYLGLRGYVKTTGATGLHIYIPLLPRYDYGQTADFVRRLGVWLRAAAPERITLERRVAKRTGRVYVDYLQNAPGKTLVAVYSARPRPGAPVSFPLDWDELDQVDPASLNLRSVPDLLERRRDRFAAVLTDRQALEEASVRLDRLLAPLKGGSD
ncbi:MAG TPA: non-homologous end-joining DNA ligase [Bacillota bacterium]